ncbi:unnamed protein product [Diatraea saccharalis]|uniref:CCHC-type domain-containing protein n=1 Tax=Diatraea saccharalis TaxID=40085 RepID=A0A9N9WJN4_9NEOP|nr:unnamed protein product [Diatraea saccharalis]
MGRECLDIYNSFTLSKDNKLKDIVEKFEQYFSPKSNVIFERFQFNQIIQKNGQSFEAFLKELKIKAKTCDYHNTDEMIRDRIVMGINCRKLQERLLRDSNLTLEMAVQLYKMAESTAIQLQQMTIDHQTMGMVQKKPVMIDCFRCGSKHISNKCPAYGKKCSKCNKNNHFAKMCKTRTHVINRHINEVTQDDREQDNASERLYIYTISHNKKHWIKTIEVGTEKLTIDFKIDTGAESCILPLSIFKKINSPLQSTNTILVAYGGQEIKPLGMVKLPCTLDYKTHLIEFFVVDFRATPLLGFDAIVKMGIIQNIDTVTTEIFKSKDDVCKKYKNLFEGLGEYPKTYTIKVCDNVIPTIQPPRTVPIAIHDKLKDK